MIHGIGVDVVQIPRMEKLLEKDDNKFTNRFFTENEIEASKQFSSLQARAAFFAKRWAAKEAFAKATGRGIRQEIRFKDIEVVNNELGQPNFILSNTIKAKFGKQSQFHLSLSDDYPIAVAYVVISNTKL